MTTQHTPTPWRVSTMFRARIAGQRADKTGTFVAACDSNDLDAPEDNANAAFIVRACNAHDELVAALKCINAALNQPATFPADIELARKQCAATLAKVQK